MVEALHSRLRPVRRRQFLQSLLSWIVIGLAGGAVLSLGFGLIRLSAGWNPGASFAWLALLAGPVCGGVAAAVWFLRRPNWIAAARAVDHHYQLKDRTESALDFSHRQLMDEKRVLAELQFEDALKHLSGLEARAVVPLNVPRGAWGAVVASLVAVGLALIPLKPTQVVAAATVPDEQIVSEAEEIEDRLAELEKEAQKEDEPELQQLVKELKQKVQEMKEPGVDVKEALAKLSDMQAAIQTAQSQANLEQVDHQLQEVGEAMASSKSLQGAGQALADGKYEKAAKELEELENVEFERKEGRNLAEKLKRAAAKKGDGEDGAISEAAGEMADAVDGEDDEAFKKGARKLGQRVEKQARKKRINAAMKGAMARLADAKNRTSKQNSNNKGKDKHNSNSPSNNYGMSEHGGLDGAPTSLDSSVNREQITGMAGDGSSEVETSSATEARQDAGRTYKEVYQKYKKMSETVLETEQIPLGHRQTIRKYFESIRPQNEDISKSNREPAKE